MSELQDSSPTERLVDLHFIKSRYFRSIHGVDFFGALSDSGDIHLTVYTERPAIPRRKTYLVNDDDSLGEEVTDNIASRNKSGTVFDVEAHLVFDLSTAQELHEFLTAQLKRAAKSGAVDTDDVDENAENQP